MLVDVAVQSYRKPESLLYALMTLKQHCAERIERVFIDDDQSPRDVLDAYRSARVIGWFRPWELVVRRNRHRVGRLPAFVKGYRPAYLSDGMFRIWGAWSIWNRRRLYVDRQDIRYQWALETSDKPFVFVMHDDIEFRGDVVGRYLEHAATLVRPAIVGDLGQCWRCMYHAEPYGCDPSRIMAGQRPSTAWPIGDPTSRINYRPCRINEWSALVSTEAARHIAEVDRVFFGNRDDDGDTGAYWFHRAVEHGYAFGDPMPTPKERARYYRHGWQGHPGHATSSGPRGTRPRYDPAFVLQAMRDRFGLTLVDDEPGAAS
jgi:hypothetical protein